MFQGRNGPRPAANTWCNVSHSLKFKWGTWEKREITISVGVGGGGGNARESKEGEKEREHSNLLSPIPRVLSVGIHRVKSESSSTQ